MCALVVGVVCGWILNIVVRCRRGGRRLCCGGDIGLRALLGDPSVVRRGRLGLEGLERRSGYVVSVGVLDLWRCGIGSGGWNIFNGFMERANVHMNQHRGFHFGAYRM